MLTSNTQSLGTDKPYETMGILTNEYVSGANFIKDAVANIMDFTGGRTAVYEKSILKGKKESLNALIKKAEKAGADGIVGIVFDVEFVGKNGTILMVSATGTAVKLLDNDILKGDPSNKE